MIFEAALRAEGFFVQPVRPGVIAYLGSRAFRAIDVGYPITVELADGALFTIYYITLADGVTHVAGTRWRLPE